MPIGVELRAEQLKDNVSRVLKLLKEYEKMYRFMKTILAERQNIERISRN